MSEAPGAAELARRLIAARSSRVPTPPPAELPMPLAIEVRDRCMAQLSQASPVAGYKVSLSTSAWGLLTREMIHADGAVLPRAAFFDPLLECELIFLADRDLAPGGTADEIIDACRVAPGIEIADSRWEGWRPSDPGNFIIPHAGLIAADNAMGGGLVIGRDWVPARSLPLPDVEISILAAGESVTSGSLRDVMGGPVEAVLWLIKVLAAAGRTITAGQVISSGCPCHTMVTVPAGGGTWSAEVAGLGAAEVVFA